jgi:hypothetical protein
MKTTSLKMVISIILIFALSVTLVFSQYSTQTDSVSVHPEKKDLNRRHSIGSTLLLLGNIGDSVNFCMKSFYTSLFSYNKLSQL